jgi:hypothetical protein
MQLKKNRITIGVSSILIMSVLSACDSDEPNVVSLPEESITLTVAAEESLEITETTSVDELTISDGGTLSASEGNSLTLTVDGVETEILAGSYSGDVVLTVTSQIPVVYSDSITNYFRTAVYVEDGLYIVDKSVAAAATNGSVSDTQAMDLDITSVGPNFNGIMVTSSEGNTDNFTYSIDNPVINFTGNGGNDFAGYGSAIMSSGYADVRVDNATITTTGAIRTAIFVGGNSTMTVNDSTIETYNGAIPEDYTFNVDLGRMMEAPWMLGITGNVRSTNLVKDGTAYYINSSITSQAWGALSTDDTNSPRLYCLNSNIKTIDSGYGAYSIGGALDYFSGCTLDVADYGIIMAAPGSATFTDFSVVNSNRIGVMLHSGSGTLIIENGTTFNTLESVIQAKSSFPTVIVDNANLNTQNGIILEMFNNDDPYGAYLQSLSTGDSGDAGGDAPADDSSSLNDGGSASTLQASILNTTVVGDIINGNTVNGGLVLSFKNTSLTGAITTTISSPAYLEYYDDGAAFFAAVVATDNYEGYNLIGQVSHTYSATTDDNGISLSLDSSSAWVVDTTSYISNLTLAEGSSITAPDGYGVVMTVDGVVTAITAGSFTGAITLTVNAI